MKSHVQLCTARIKYEGGCLHISLGLAVGTNSSLEKFLADLYTVDVPYAG